MHKGTETKIEKVRTAMAEGSSVTQACKRHKLSTMTYRKYASARPKKSGVVIAIPETTPGHVLAFYGAPELVAQVARSLQ